MWLGIYYVLLYVAGGESAPRGGFVFAAGGNKNRVLQRPHWIQRKEIKEGI